jgi:hypothetical protein
VDGLPNGGAFSAIRHYFVIIQCPNWVKKARKKLHRGNDGHLEIYRSYLAATVE